MLAFSIIAVAITAITYKTYMGYGEYSILAKLLFLLFLIISITAPVIIYIMHRALPDNPISAYTKPFYFLFGFVIILFLVTFLRDIIWSIIDFIRHVSLEEMKNPIHLQKANIITIIACLGICLYGYYEAEKTAQIVAYDITSPKIKKPTKVVMLSDLHIDIDTSSKYIQKLVERVNTLKPDAIVIVGDVIDNTPFVLSKQMDELEKLKATDGVYVVLGNHEFYNGGLDWGMKFGQMRFNFLNNHGMKLNDSGIYIAGIPDINTASMLKMPIKMENALYSADKNDYRILLSHTPKIATGVNKDNVDLQLSAHTHGGQIYPFHYMVKQHNDGHIAGFYDVDGVRLYVSRGTRYWGPPLRLLAPSEITVFNFKPEPENAK